MTHVAEKSNRKVHSQADAPLSLQRLFWLGLIGAFMGAVVETIFMLVTRGKLLNRSGLLYGQFSLVWGGGAILFALLLRRLARYGKWAVFLGGAAVGTVFELLCSWFQEACFGVIFWDYSHLPLSIGGRINLIFSFFWGTSATLWVCWIMPWLNDLLDRVPKGWVRPATTVAVVFLAVDIGLTVCALNRLEARQEDLPARNAMELFLDREYPDDRLFQRFANMRYLGDYISEHPNFW